MVYLTDLIKYWKYPAIAWDEVDTARLKAYMGLSMGMGLTYLVRLDESIIGVAFAQIVMEGRVDPRLKYYVQKALEREMLPMITRNFGNADQQKAHDGKIGKMLFVVNHMQ